MDHESKGSGLSASLKKRRGWLVASLVVLVVASVFAGLASSSPPSSPATETSSDAQATWWRWGMSIQHPSGLTSRYMGLEEPNATSNSGLVQWVWNNDGTSLTLLWANATQSEIQPGLPGIRDLARIGMTDVVVGDGGNITLGGAAWEYQTYSGLLHGEAVYSAVAASYYASSHRLYVLVLVDRIPGSLATLVSYGRTFSG